MRQTHAELEGVINEALNVVPFEPPVSMEYCIALRDRMRIQAPNAKIDAYHRHVDVVLELRTEDALVNVVTPLV